LRCSPILQWLTIHHKEIGYSTGLGKPTVLGLGVGQVRVWCLFTPNPPLLQTHGLGYSFPDGSSKAWTWTTMMTMAHTCTCTLAELRLEWLMDSDNNDDDDDDRRRWRWMTTMDNNNGQRWTQHVTVIQARLVVHPRSGAGASLAGSHPSSH
jgi:hypothetical protein